MAGPDALAAKRVRHALRAASSKKRARAHIERVYANRLQETVAQGGTWKQAAQKLAEAEGKAVNDYPSVMPPSFMGLHDAQSLQHISEMYSFLTSRRKLKKGSQACRRRATSSRTPSSTLPPKAKASLWQTWAANRASNSFCLENGRILRDLAGKVEPVTFLRSDIAELQAMLLQFSAKIGDVLADVLVISQIGHVKVRLHLIFEECRAALIGLDNPPALPVTILHLRSDACPLLTVGPAFKYLRMP